MTEQAVTEVTEEAEAEVAEVTDLFFSRRSREAEKRSPHAGDGCSRIDQALHSVHQLRHVEVDQQAGRRAQQSHLCERLRMMDRQQRGHAFDFDDDLFFYKQIDEVILTE